MLLRAVGTGAIRWGLAGGESFLQARASSLRCRGGQRARQDAGSSDFDVGKMLVLNIG